MAKPEEEIQEEKIETPEEIAPEVKAVSLAQIPTQYGLVYRTPEGDMSSDEYLVWLGNMFLEFKEAIAGN
jgi:hypothetical protein